MKSVKYIKYVNTIIKRFGPMGKAGLVLVLSAFIIALFSGSLLFYPYNVPSGGALEAPNAMHWLGTDDLGIDILAQILRGTRISILVGFGTAILAGVGGSVVGVLSGYFGGLIDRSIMRITDMVIVLPQLPAMIVLGAFFGPGIWNIVIVLSLFAWTVPARIVRSKILSVKQEKYVQAARSYGAGFWHITRWHFLPNILPLISVSVIKVASNAIVAEASLAFLGLGDPTSKSWGIILNHAINFKGIYFTDYWKWWVISPAAAIMILVAAIAFIGRDLEKITNSKV